MKKYLLTICAMLLFSASNLFAVDGALVKFEVFQFNTETDKNQILYTDSAEIATGKIITGFIGPISVDFELLKTDSLRSNFNVHLVTLGPSANTYSKNYTVEYSLPARIDNITGKNNSTYTLAITPLAFISVDSSLCEFNHRTKSDFTVKPTAHTDIYYIPSSLGDFYFDSIKELMEASFRQYKKFLNMNMPGKTHIYVSPCPINSVFWDKRFGTSVDPTRNTAFAVYNQDFNTADPFILNHVSTLRMLGYSAPFLSEGLANYFSFAMYDMKEIIKEKKQVAIESIVNTHDYYNADAQIADRTSSTFVKYLIDTYSLSTFLKLYKQSDDINVASQMLLIYGKTVSELETEWHTYIDTLSIDPLMYVAYASKAEVMIDYKLMHKYNLAFLAIAANKNDSIRALDQLKRSSFFNGNYYAAQDYQKALLKLNGDAATGRMALGSYQMMNGLFDEAFDNFQKADTMDTGNQMIQFNLAMYYINRGDNNKAKEILVNNFDDSKGSSAQGETRILLANILKDSPEKTDQEKAAFYYQEAVRMYSGALQTNSSTPSIYMWLGISHLGLYEYTDAINYLHIAEFIESRPFYVGMINLWLGKTYLAAGELDNAKLYFDAVITNSSSVYHQQEAKDILKTIK